MSFARVPLLLPIFAWTALSTASCSQAQGAEGPFHWTIATTVEIDAAPSHVWQVLVDLPAYSRWNPFIVEAAGDVVVGGKLSMRMTVGGRDPMTIEPRLLVVDPQRELRWKGRLLVPGLFDGEHGFTLTALEGRRTRLEHWERFSGLLLPLARRLIYEDTLRAFHSFNDALAKEARRRFT
jgi:hypothetical protein